MSLNLLLRFTIGTYINHNSYTHRISVRFREFVVFLKQVNYLILVRDRLKDSLTLGLWRSLGHTYDS